MGPAEDWKFVAVQQPVKPVTGRLRDHYGVHERREDPDKSAVETFTDHGAPLPSASGFRDRTSPRGMSERTPKTPIPTKKIFLILLTCFCGCLARLTDDTHGGKGAQAT